jgi:transcriptional regulator with XRE-family HTH domain
MSGHVRWAEVRAGFIAEAGGPEAFEAGKQELMAQVIGARLAELRKTRGFTQQQIAERMGVTKGQVSQIERGQVSGQDVLAATPQRWAVTCTRPSTSTTATSPPSPDPIRRPDHQLRPTHEPPHSTGRGERALIKGSLYKRCQCRDAHGRRVPDCAQPHGSCGGSASTSAVTTGREVVGRSRGQGSPAGRPPSGPCRMS